MKINKPGLILYISIAAILVILISAALYYSSIQQDDAVRINLAGRQRMLSQKILKELLLYGSNEVSQGTVIQSVNIFSQTQKALIHGGPAPITLDFSHTRILPELQDGEALKQLHDIAQIWEPIENQINRYLADKNPESLKYIISKNDLFLQMTNDSAYALQKKSEKNSSIIQVIITTFIMIILTFFFLYTYRKVRQLREADKRIKELETLLPICSSCKKIRTNNDEPEEIKSWTSIEEYLRKNNEMIFTHTVCPECMKKLYPEIK